MGFEQFFRKFYTRRPNAPSGHHCRRPRKIRPRKRPIHWTTFTKKLLKSFKTSLQKLNTRTLKIIIRLLLTQKFKISTVPEFLLFDFWPFRESALGGVSTVLVWNEYFNYLKQYMLQINIRYFKNTVNVLDKFFISWKNRLSERCWKSVFKE